MPRWFQHGRWWPSLPTTPEEQWVYYLHTGDVMPPETEPIPRPRTRGQDAKDYLDAHGLVARSPTIRASDYEMVLNDPFYYYLTRRLGLCDVTSVNISFLRGGWFHERFAVWNTPVEMQTRILNEKLANRLSEVQTICRDHGFSHEARHSWQEEIVKSFSMAQAWFHALLHIQLPRRTMNFYQWMSQPHFRDLGGEIRVKVQIPGISQWCVCQLDRLLYHEDQNTVWIVDPKTCAEPTTIRIASCPIEFQTQHYMHIVQKAIDEGMLQDSFNLPMDVRLGGFIHVCVQKPTITFGTKDRYRTEREHTLKSGPRKGEVETRYTYEGEPIYDNYVQRCVRWYRAEGEYESLAEKRRESPVINMSVVEASALQNEDWCDEYMSRLQLVSDYASLNPLPRNFLRSARSINRFGRLSPMAPFYLADCGSWPALIRERRLTTSWRDTDILDEVGGDNDQSSITVLAENPDGEEDNDT